MAAEAPQDEADPAQRLAQTVAPFDLARRMLAAEEKLAAIRSVLLEGGQDTGTARRRALAIFGDLGQVPSYDRGMDGPVL